MADFLLLGYFLHFKDNAFLWRIKLNRPAVIHSFICKFLDVIFLEVIDLKIISEITVLNSK